MSVLCRQQSGSGRLEQFPPVLYVCVSLLVAVAAVLVVTVQELYQLRQQTRGQEGSPCSDWPPRVWVAGKKVSRDRGGQRLVTCLQAMI